MRSFEVLKFALSTVAALTLLPACDASDATSENSKSAQPRAAKLVQLVAKPVVAAPETAGISYPFASHKVAYVAGIKPSQEPQETQDALIRSRYDAWKSGVSQRCGGYVVDFKASYATVSEGMGYGMLLTVLMAGHDTAARTLFDGFFKVVRSRPAFKVDPALMDWRINTDCSSAGDGYNAMDGDLDIAMALLMADRQWGSGGAVNYKAEGLKTIAALKRHNMHPDGHTKGLPNQNNSRTSDYMITHFKAFKRASGDPYWDLATDRAFGLLELMQTKHAPATGLLPDFIIKLDTADPVPSPGWVADNNENEGYYFWNACRIPWRMAADHVTSGDPRSKAVASRLTEFFLRASEGRPGQIQSGYKLDGKGLSTYAAPAFIGPATAGAMVDARFQPFLNSLWSYSRANAAKGYYESELQLLSLVVASGNWWNP